MQGERAAPALNSLQSYLKHILGLIHRQSIISGPNLDFLESKFTPKNLKKILGTRADQISRNLHQGPEETKSQENYIRVQTKHKKLCYNSSMLDHAR